MADLVTLLAQRADRGEPVGADEIIARLESRLAGREGLSVVDDEATTVSPQRPQWHRAVTVAAAAFVVVMSIGSVLWLIKPGEPNEVVDPTTTTTPVTTVTTTIPVTTTVPVPTTVPPIDKVEWPWGRWNTQLVSIGEGRMFMFGGASGIDVQRNDTWILDVAALEWTQLTPDKSPWSRSEHAAFYYPEADQVFIFGGLVGSTVLDDMWVYDLAANTWTVIEAEGPIPEARLGAMLVYVDSIDRAILYGGNRSGATTPTFHDIVTDMWLFDPVALRWSEANPSPGPSPRAYAGVAHDSLSDKIVLVGGMRNGTATDSITWVLDPATLTWSERSDSPTVAAALEARDFAPSQPMIAGYVPSVDRVVVYSDGTVASYDLDTDSWTPVVEAPGDLIAMAVGVDPTFSQFMLFGGVEPDAQTESLTVNNDLWLLSPDLSAWTRVPSPS